MLTKPEAGWTNVKIGDYECQASYLTNVPMDCLNSMINAIQNYLPFCVDFDAEGWFFTVISSSYIYDTYVIEDKEEAKVHQYDNIKLTDLAKELYRDINENLDDWNMWLPCAKYESEETKEYREELISKLDLLDQLIKERQSQ